MPRRVSSSRVEVSAGGEGVDIVRLSGPDASRQACAKGPKEGEVRA
jgi:hypothetical protein